MTIAPSSSQEVGRSMEAWFPSAARDGAPRDPAEPWPEVIRALISGHQLLAAAQWALERGYVDIGMSLARHLLEFRRDAATLRVSCRIAYDAACLDEGMDWAAELERATPPPGPGERKLMAAIRERFGVLERLARPPVDSPSFEPETGRALSLLAYSLPVTSNGYATRSHGLLSAVQDLGWQVMPFTRPGYPSDTGSAPVVEEGPHTDMVDALQYGRLFRSTRRRLGHMPYLHAAADEIMELIGRIRPQVVHAASNYMTALPACLAAREAGLPFVYEVRGFWDVTRASSEPGFLGSSENRYLRLFEAALLERADAVITLTATMRDELIRRGAPADRILVAPNAVDANRLQPLARDMVAAQRLGIPAGRPVIGYVGSFVDYEGLDDLIDACATLRDSGRTFHLLLVGDGLAMETVKERIQACGMHGLVTLTGRVPHNEVASIYSLIDICPFPRKPWPVCELVSPLKPFEAMALEKAVLVSDVAAMAEMIQDGVNGRRFAKGNQAALTEALARLLDDPADTAALGKRARSWVQGRRTWRQSAMTLAQAYDLACRNRVSARGRTVIADNPPFRTTHAGI